MNTAIKRQKTITYFQVPVLSHKDVVASKASNSKLVILSFLLPIHVSVIELLLAQCFLNITSVLPLPHINWKIRFLTASKKDLLGKKNSRNIIQLRNENHVYFSLHREVGGVGQYAVKIAMHSAKGSVVQPPP